MKKRKVTLDGVKKKEDRFLEITALVFAILSLSLGFLALSSQLKINEELTAHPDELRFKVVFSSEQNKVSEKSIVPTISPSGADVSAKNAIIDNSKHPVIRNIDVHFTSPGQKVKYNFYIRNAGEYMAYLNSISYNNVSGFKTSKICLTKDGKTNDTINEVCENIKISIKVGDLTTSKSLYNIENKTLRPMTSQAVEVTIEYLEGSISPKEEFEVLFGDITLYYSMFSGHNESNSDENSNVEVS